MAIDIQSGFGGAFNRHALSVFGATVLATAYSTSAFGQTANIPDTLPTSISADCQSQSAYASNSPNEIVHQRPQPAAGAMQESKSVAILGGQRSRLEEMRDSQSAQQQYSQDAAPISTARLVVLQAPQTNECVNKPPNLQIVRSEANLTLPSNVILGSLSLAIRHSPFDREWAAVNKTRTSRLTYRTLTATGARNSGDQTAQVATVNRWVNRNIAFGEDRDVYRRADYWAPAAETLRRGVGDCEDFAIAKMELLSVLGIARDKMRLVVARDLARNADHAVLVVTLSDGRTIMLDNMTDRLLDARLPNDYRPIMSFSQNAKWVHGYAVQPAQQVRMASVAPVLPAATLKLADVLTVTAEPEMPVLSIALLSVPLVLPNGLLSRA